MWKFYSDGIRTHDLQNTSLLPLLPAPIKSVKPKLERENRNVSWKIRVHYWMWKQSLIKVKNVMAKNRKVWNADLHCFITSLRRDFIAAMVKKGY